MYRATHYTTKLHYKSTSYAGGMHKVQEEGFKMPLNEYFTVKLFIHIVRRVSGKLTLFSKSLCSQWIFLGLSFINRNSWNPISIWRQILFSDYNSPIGLKKNIFRNGLWCSLAWQQKSVLLNILCWYTRCECLKTKIFPWRSFAVVMVSDLIVHCKDHAPKTSTQMNYFKNTW